MGSTGGGGGEAGVGQEELVSRCAAFVRGKASVRVECSRYRLTLGVLKRGCDALHGMISQSAGRGERGGGGGGGDLVEMNTDVNKGRESTCVCRRFFAAGVTDSTG